MASVLPPSSSLDTTMFPSPSRPDPQTGGGIPTPDFNAIMNEYFGADAVEGFDTLSAPLSGLPEMQPTLSLGPVPGLPFFSSPGPSTPLCGRTPNPTPTLLSRRSRGSPSLAIQQPLSLSSGAFSLPTPTESGSTFRMQPALLDKPEIVIDPALTLRTPTDDGQSMSNAMRTGSRKRSLDDDEGRGSYLAVPSTASSRFSSPTVVAPSVTSSGFSTRVSSPGPAGMTPSAFPTSLPLSYPHPSGVPIFNAEGAAVGWYAGNATLSLLLTSLGVPGESPPLELPSDLLGGIPIKARSPSPAPTSSRPTVKRRRPFLVAPPLASAPAPVVEEKKEPTREEMQKLWLEFFTETERVRAMGLPSVCGPMEPECECPFGGLRERESKRRKVS